MVPSFMAIEKLQRELHQRKEERNTFCLSSLFDSGISGVENSDKSEWGIVLLRSLDTRASGRHKETVPCITASFSQSKYKEPELPQFSFLTQSCSLNNRIVTWGINIQKCHGASEVFGNSRASYSSWLRITWVLGSKKNQLLPRIPQASCFQVLYLNKLKNEIYRKWKDTFRIKFYYIYIYSNPLLGCSQWKWHCYLQSKKSQEQDNRKTQLSPTTQRIGVTRHMVGPNCKE